MYLFIESHYQFQISLTSTYALASGRIMQGVLPDREIENIQISFSDGTQKQVGCEKRTNRHG